MTGAIEFRGDELDIEERRTYFNISLIGSLEALLYIWIFLSIHDIDVAGWIWVALSTYVAVGAIIAVSIRFSERRRITIYTLRYIIAHIWPIVLLAHFTYSLIYEISIIACLATAVRYGSRIISRLIEVPPMTDTCIECGKRPAVPGKAGHRCIECIRGWTDADL